ncbi:DNA polymerase III subunit gamma/tau [Bifidobacterium sp. MA2]|uniref:DNA-directed DNA polymerase n=1 Tax=Bifidobacterium santillanense TaxID=2809028 RepID=A0ABS5USE9_9BIFI|nr:DNA polymerase III subunit gamma/tau [Bifidobacterium santillanense]MBT1173731.1 DNA polymerase III subunit gamma/tau [Bifidobacterium santillanense]
MALALYRRYRPDTFEGVIGQDQVTVPLMRALDEGKLTHAYLFSGPRGCGKTSSARILARCVNCAKGPTSHPCGECESCKDLATGGPGSIDVVEIDAASHNGVDDARELRERAGFAPARDRYKIFILDEAHMVTPQGFNALLKIVEEPPEHVMFIFATTEPDKVIGTIRSRTHHYPFRLVPAEIMGPYLERICDEEHIKPEPGVLKLAMRAGGGSVRDTLSVLDQLMVGSVDGVITHDASVALLGFTPEALIGEAVDAVIDRSGEQLYGVIQKVVVGGFDPRRFVEDLLARVRDLLVLTLAGDKAESVLSDTAEAEDMDDLHRQAAALGLGSLTAMADIINDTLGAMTGAISPRMRLELLAARLLSGAEHGFAAAPVVGGGAPVAVPAGSGVAPAAGAATAGSGHGGFAGAARNAGGGFAGAARNQHADSRAGEQAGGSAGSGHGTDAVRHSDPVAQASPVSSGNAGDVSSSAAPGATGSAGAGASVPQPDDRTPDQKWDALVAALPADVRRYVTRDKVLRISFRPYKQTGRMRLWLKFDKPLSKYAFALAVAAESVDGSNKVVNILRAEVRKVFGEQTEIAPTPTTDDGQKTPAFSKLPAGEQQRIKAQLLQENLQAAVNLTRTESNGQESGRETSSPAAHASGASSSDDDESHRSGSTATVGAGPSSPSVLDDDDPWAQPLPTASSAGGRSDTATGPGSGASASTGSQVVTGHEPEHPHKHVAVPDLSDDVDPWAQPAGTVGGSGANPTSAEASTQHASDPWNTTSGVPGNGGTTVNPWSQTSSATGGIGASHPADDPWNRPVNGTGTTVDDPWNQPSAAVNGAGRTQTADDPWNQPAKPAGAGAWGGPRQSAAQTPAPSAPGEPDDPWKDVPPPGEPDDPWNAGPTAPHGTGLGTDSRSAGSPNDMNAGGTTMPARDPWNVGQPAPAAPQVAADEDEYSMDDESLGAATAMDRDELRKLFEVKKVEEFAADDPRNPRNIHPAPRHDDE